jgi:hypothetical protein
MRGGIYARLEIKNAIERIYDLTQPHRGADRWLVFAEGKVAPRIHTRVPEQGRDSRREARFNHRTVSAAAEGERETEGSPFSIALSHAVAAEPAQSRLFLVPRCFRSH